MRLRCSVASQISNIPSPKTKQHQRQMVNRTKVTKRKVVNYSSDYSNIVNVRLNF